MHEQPSNIRAFIGIVLPENARLGLQRIQECLRQSGLSLAYTHLEDAHLTLVFLGETPPETIARLKPDIDEVASRFSPFTIKLGGGGFYGPPRAPRVAWVGVDELPELMALQATLAAASGAAGVALEKRSFHPHFTMARIKHRLAPDALTLIKSSINNTRFAEVQVDRVVLMRSRPNGTGPRYSIIHESHLKGR